MKNAISACTLFALLAVPLVACINKSPEAHVKSERVPISPSQASTDPTIQERFKSALRDAGVDHKVYIGNDGLEYVHWKAENSKTVEPIKAKLFDQMRSVALAFPDPRLTAFHKQVLTAMRLSFIVETTEQGEAVWWTSADEAQELEVQRRVSQYAFVLKACGQPDLVTPETPAGTITTC